MYERHAKFLGVVTQVPGAQWVAPDEGIRWPPCRIPALSYTFWYNPSMSLSTRLSQAEYTSARQTICVVCKHVESMSEEDAQQVNEAFYKITQRQLADILTEEGYPCKAHNIGYHFREHVQKEKV